jgi:hypothetical protein
MKSFKRVKALFMDPFFWDTLKPLKRANLASSINPMTVATRGWLTMSDNAPLYLGTPRLTGFKKMSSPNSTMPGMTALPPVKTMPEDKTSS